MYVQEFLLFVASTYGLKNARQKVRQTIADVGLEDEQFKKISMLSKGYKQRVGLAQAIIHEPQVLILDEPTSGLDPNQLIGIRALIKKLGQNITVILSTHIMQEVEAICDDVIIINKGKIVANAPIADLKKEQQLDSLEAIFIKLTS
jgi:ABC-2 type transport system ATP-binding protein